MAHPALLDWRSQQPNFRTPKQLEVLGCMPAGYLEYLALTACDDGAMGDVSVEKYIYDPTMVRIDTMMQQTALGLMRWIRVIKSSQSALLLLPYPFAGGPLILPREDGICSIQHR